MKNKNYLILGLSVIILLEVILRKQTDNTASRFALTILAFSLQGSLIPDQEIKRIIWVISLILLLLIGILDFGFDYFKC